MFAIALKGLRANARRLVGTFVAILLGVSFTAGVMMLTDTTTAAFDTLFRTEGSGVDVVVRATPPVDRQGGGGGGRGGDQRVVPASLADQLRKVDGVAAVEVIHQTRRGVVVVGKNGQPTSSGFGAPFLASGYPTDQAMNPFTLVGKPPTGADQVVLDANTADIAQTKIGETITIRTPSKVGTFRLVGTVTLGSSATGGSGRALFAPSVAQGFNTVPGTASRIQLRAKAGISQEELRTKVAPIVAATPSQVPIEAITGTAYVAELRARIADFLVILNNGLLGFAVLSLFVGAFIVYNTFSILVTQRQRELALFRAVGASKRQVVGAVMAEALVVGLVAGFAGVAGGAGLSIALSSGFKAFGVALPSGPLVVTPSVVLIAAATGLFMALACAWFPSRRAARIPPVAALRDVAIDRSTKSRTRIVFGVMFVIASGVFLGLGLSNTGTAAAIRVGIATAAAFIGITVLGPFIASPVASLIGVPMRAFGITGRLATQNARRNPRRTASTAAALMIGVAMVTFVLVMSATLKGIIVETTKRAITADVIVTGDAEGRTALTTGSIADAARVRGAKRVGAVTMLRASGFGTSDRPERIAAATPTALRQSPLVMTAGSLDQLGTNGIAVSKQAADENKVKLGDPITLTFIDGTVAHVSVVGIVDDLSVVDTDLLVSSAFATANQPDVGPSQILVDRTAAVSTNELIRNLKAVPSLIGTQVQDISSFADAQASSLNAIVGVFLVMLGLSVVIALFGIANTLSLSIYERTRELGLLRAVGSTRSQIGALVRLESIILALLGTTQGAVIGLVFGSAIAQTLVTDPTAPKGLSIVIPWLQMVGVIAVAILAGVLASVAATRRAKRLEVLKAIGVE